MDGLKMGNTTNINVYADDRFKLYQLTWALGVPSNQALEKVLERQSRPTGAKPQKKGTLRFFTRRKRAAKIAKLRQGNHFVNILRALARKRHEAMADTVHWLLSSMTEPIEIVAEIVPEKEDPTAFWGRVHREYYDVWKR